MNLLDQGFVQLLRDTTRHINAVEIADFEQRLSKIPVAKDFEHIYLTSLEISLRLSQSGTILIHGQMANLLAKIPSYRNRIYCDKNQEKIFSGTQFFYPPLDNINKYVLRQK